MSADPFDPPYSASDVMIVGSEIARSEAPTGDATETKVGFVITAELQELETHRKEYIEAGRADNTRRSYVTGWRIFEAWRDKAGYDNSIPPCEQEVGDFITHLAKSGFAVATIESRLAAVLSHCRDVGSPLDYSHKDIGGVLRGVKRKHGAPQKVKEAVLAEEFEKMLGVLGFDLRGMRDRAILLVGYAGSLRRSEIVGLDVGRQQTEDGRGWIEIVEEGLVLHVKGKTGWREVVIARGSKQATCATEAVMAWMRFGRIAHGPLFRRIRGKDNVTADRLSDRKVALLVIACAAAAGLRPDLPEKARKAAFGGHSLRAGLATSAQADEATIQKHLGHASPQMTRRYQRHRDRFRVNLMKAAGH